MSHARTSFSGEELRVHRLLVERTETLLDKLAIAVREEFDKQRHVLDGNLQQAKELLNEVAHLLDVEVLG